jgi:methylmalonyl-CoA mutase cobalamin-binding domain/chain
LKTRPGKILMVEIGTDEHDRSAQALAAGLRDGGLEVVFTGRFAAADALARSALEEDVDLIVLCSTTPAALPISEIATALAQTGLQHIGLITGLVATGGEAPPPAGVAAVIDAATLDEQTFRQLHDLVEAGRAKRSVLP